MTYKVPSVIHSQLSADKMAAVQDAMRNFKAEEFQDLRRLGIEISDKQLDRMVANAMDAIQPDITTPSMITPVQFLQNWLPGFVAVVTAVRNIDLLIGIMTTGAWEDEQVVLGIKELTGPTVPYGDLTNVPFLNYNVNFVERTVTRWEAGMKVAPLEQQRAARIRIDSAAEKRAAIAQALEIRRNQVGFFGFNSGNNNTYGFLNDPNLPSYITATVGASTSTHWSTKTFLEITNDIKLMVSGLLTTSLGQADVTKVPATLAISQDAVTYLSTVSDFGISVRMWLNETFPKIRVESAPELNNANGGANVAYLYADKILDDASSDDGSVFIQPVPQKFMVLGVALTSKGTEEDYSNATAGTFLKRPFAVFRLTGI